MKLIDGKGAVLGRLASYVAKEALKGEDVNVLNCEKIIITGNKETIKKEFDVKRSRVGSSQKGPKHPATNEKMVKRAIRGMLPNHRTGRGKIALSKIKCYVGIPKEFEGKEFSEFEKKNPIKFAEVKEFTKKKW